MPGTLDYFVASVTAIFVNFFIMQSPKQYPNGQIEWLSFPIYHLLYVNFTFCKFDTLNSNDDRWSHWNVIQSNVHVINLVWSLSNNDDYW